MWVGQSEEILGVKGFIVVCMGRGGPEREEFKKEKQLMIK